MSPVAAIDALAALWVDAGLPRAALACAGLPGTEPALPSSFAVGTAAQTSLAAAALAAAEVGHWRGQPRQRVTVPMRDAALECCGHFTLDGREPVVWDELSGLYPCAGGGWLRIHANFAHHRDRALEVIGCPAGPATTRGAVTAALANRPAVSVEQAVAEHGGAAAALRDFDTWDRHPQAHAIACLPLVSIERIGDAPARTPAPLQADEQPLAGLRVLELTRILAGPVCGRTLAAYGADVMLVNSPSLPNIAAIADTSRGKRSVQVDLDTESGRSVLRTLLSEADVFVQGYRPGALAARGFDAGTVAALRPGVIVVSLSAYGHEGPWAQRRGFDSLVQTATGFNRAEADAAGETRPRALPMQILDFASGFLMAFGAQAALLRQAREGGSWHVRIALARTGAWLRTLGRVAGGLAGPPARFDDCLEHYASGFGELVAVRHAARFARTPARWTRPSVPPGTDAAAWS